MYKSPSRNHRSKGGIKLKHILQICILIAVCFWLVYQVKRSHEKKQEFDGKDGRLVAETETGGEMLKLGRKDVPRISDAGEDGKVNGEDEEDNEADEEENKHDEDDKEGEQNNIKEREEDEGEETSRGGGGIEDEIDEREREKTDGETENEGEVEETDNKEKGEETENGEEGEEKSVDNEEAGEKEEAHRDNGTEAEDKENETGDEDTKEAREENYKADDASSEVTHEAVNSTLEHTNDILQLNNSDVGKLTLSSDQDGEATENPSNSTNTGELKNKDSPFVFEDTSSDNSTLSESELVKKLVSDTSGNSTNSTNIDEPNDKDRTKLEDISAENSILPSEPKLSNSQSQLDNNLSSEKSQNATALLDEIHIPSNVTNAQNTTVDAKPVEEGSSSHIEMRTQTNNSELATGVEQLTRETTASNTSNEEVKSHDTDKASNGEDPDEELKKSAEKTGNGESNDETHGTEEEHGETNGELEGFDSQSEKENGGTNGDLEGFDSSLSEKENGGTNGELEGFDSSQSEKENADPEQHDDPIDDSDSSLTQEEKDTRTDLDTLPDITTEGQSTEVAEAE